MPADRAAEAGRLWKAGCRRQRERVGAKQRDGQGVGIRRAYRVAASRRRIGKRVCSAETFSVVLIERITLDSAGGAAGGSIGRCATRSVLGGKVQATDDPQHSRNIDYPEYEPKERG